MTRLDSWLGYPKAFETHWPLSPPGPPRRAFLCKPVWQAYCSRVRMAVFHLECSVHRRCASGLSVATEQLDATTNAEAIGRAEARFVELLAERAGSAMLWDAAGQVVWATRRFAPEAGNAAAAPGH
ncbi:hypothetical protein MKK84_13095 [Methylobacterium sp. E-065]|uniref:hypothetical protein n=1 Tax=Methylobacterium sp. E-065 TaxID=2836583 RepID=UPI001FB97BBA|nr:hypothetical protein [Methylobacterium sp. E-065]MCJ2018355.1 hypothetical protein [Methylobacterium sp. E-065]